MEKAENSAYAPKGVETMPVSRKILIVEDELAVMLSVIDTMDNVGYEIVRAYNGKECMRIICTGFVPDLILLDIMLPDISGFEVYTDLRSLPALKKTKIAAFTALGSKDTVQKMKTLGFDGIFLKPYSPGKLISAIKSLLEKTY